MDFLALCPIRNTQGITIFPTFLFSFQGKFYKQLHGAAMGSPFLPVVANISMEYFEKRALGPELPVSFTINTWLRYVDDVLTIVKKGTHDSSKLSKFN